MLRKLGQRFDRELLTVFERLKAINALAKACTVEIQIQDYSDLQ